MNRSLLHRGKWSRRLLCEAAISGGGCEPHQRTAWASRREPGGRRAARGAGSAPSALPAGTAAAARRRAPGCTGSRVPAARHGCGERLPAGGTAGTAGTRSARRLPAARKTERVCAAAGATGTTDGSKSPSNGLRKQSRRPFGGPGRAPPASRMLREVLCVELSSDVPCLMSFYSTRTA